MALAACVAALLGSVAVVGLAKVEIDTSVDSFLPADDPTATALADKVTVFGGDPVVVLLEFAEDRRMLTSTQDLLELVRLEGELAALPDVVAVYGPGTVLNQTAGAAQDMLAQISGRRDALRNQAELAAQEQGADAADVAEAGRQAVALFDRRYGSLLVQSLPAGLPTVRNPRFAETVIFDENGQPRPQWQPIVPAPDTVALLVRPGDGVDQDANAELVDAISSAVEGSSLEPTRTTITGAPVLTAALTESSREEAPRLGVASVLLVGLVFLLAPWTARRRSRLRPVTCALLGTAATLACFGWFDSSLSLGVVAFLPILLGIGSDFPLYVALGRRDRRTLVAAFGAAVGFGALVLSPLPFVAELGLALVLGLAWTVAIAYGLRWVLGPVPGAATVPAPGAAEGAVAGHPSQPDAPRPPGPWVRGGICAVAVGLAVVGWVMLPRLEIEAQPEKLAAGLPALVDVERAEDVLRSTGEVNLVLRGQDLARAEVLEWTRDAQDSLVQALGDRVRPVLSLADLLRFLGDEPTPEQVEAGLQLVPRYLTSTVLTSDRTGAVVVLGIEFDDVDELGTLLDDVDRAVGEPPPGVDLEVVGLPVAAVRGLELVNGSRTWLNVASILAAALVVLVGLRRVRDAAAALLTVLLATGWVTVVAVGLLGALNPLTVAIGSLTTATGVEFAVMLAAGSRVVGQRSARPAIAVGVAAVAGTLGYLVLALSDLAVLRDFGLLLGASVASTFLAAVVVTRFVLTAPPSDGPGSTRARGDSDEQAPRKEEVSV